MRRVRLRGGRVQRPASRLERPRPAVGGAGTVRRVRPSVERPRAGRRTATKSLPHAATGSCSLLVDPVLVLTPRPLGGLHDNVNAGFRHAGTLEELERQRFMMGKATEVERLRGAACQSYIEPSRGDLKHKAAARLLTDKLREKGLLPADGSPAQLPVENELKALWQVNRLPGTPFGWVAGDGDGVFVAKTSADSFVLKHADKNDLAGSAAFRVLISNHDGLGLSPKLASGVVLPEGGAK